MFFIGKPYISVRDSIPIVDTVAYCSDNITIPISSVKCGLLHCTVVN